MARVLSGIQPTGTFTLGNYLGAVRRWAQEGQFADDAFFFVPDLHAMTVKHDPSVLAQNTLETVAQLLACGLDPKQCTLFLQSHIPENARLTWLLECTASYGQMQRMTQFKDKTAKGGQESARVGLFTYPILMAADILLYDIDEVPVGEDQKQHVELTRDLAQRFNHDYGNIFVVPKPVLPKVGARLMDLQDPTKKMSKSADTMAGVILLDDDNATIEKKFKRAVTDTETNVAYDPKTRPGVANLLDIFSAISGDKPEKIAERYEQYGPLKADVATAVIGELSPVRERYAELMKDTSYLQSVLKDGAAKAGSIASATYERATKAVGLLQP